MTSVTDEIKINIGTFKDRNDKYVNYLEEAISEFEELKREGLASPRGNNLMPIEERFTRRFCFNSRIGDCTP